MNAREILSQHARDNEQDMGESLKYLNHIFWDRIIVIAYTIIYF